MLRQSRCLRRGALVCLLVLAYAGIAYAQDCWHYDSPDPAPILGNLAVYCSRGVAVQGQYAYVPDENHLNVVDVSVPSAPSIVAQVSAEWAGEPQTIVVQSGLAYVCHGTAGLCIYDVTDPNEPQLLGACSFFCSPLDVSVVGGYAYVVTNMILEAVACLYVVDVSDPATPDITGTLQLDEYSPLCCTEPTPEGFVYVGTSLRRLLVVDVQDPAAPSLVADVDATGRVADIERRGDYLYLALNAANPTTFPDLRVFNIADRLAPVAVGGLALPGIGAGVVVAFPKAYVACSDEGVQVVDVSSPASPVWIGGVDTPGCALHVAVTDSLLLIADFTSGLQIALPDCDDASPVTGGAVPGIALRSVFPNPFNPRATIECELPQPGWIRLAIHDPRGRVVRVLREGQVAAGVWREAWDGKDGQGRQQPSGTYVVRLTTELGTWADKVTLTK